MKQIQAGILISLIFAFMSCKVKNDLIFEEYDFKVKGFDWDPNPYKLSKFIQDSVLQNQGFQYASYDYSYIGNI